MQLLHTQKDSVEFSFKGEWLIIDVEMIVLQDDFSWTLQELLSWSFNPVVHPILNLLIEQTDSPIVATLKGEITECIINVIKHKLALFTLNNQPSTTFDENVIEITGTNN